MDRNRDHKEMGPVLEAVYMDIVHKDLDNWMAEHRGLDRVAVDKDSHKLDLDNTLLLDHSFLDHMDFVDRGPDNENPVHRDLDNLDFGSDSDFDNSHSGAFEFLPSDKLNNPPAVSFLPVI